MTDPISNERLARELWKEHGGTQHGPRTETLTMPEANFNAFVSDLLQSRRQSPAGVEPVWFAVQSASGAHIGMWQDESIARRIFKIEYPDGKFIPLYASPPPKAVTITDEMVERAAEAVAKSWGETWRCVCSEKRGLDCDCGSAMTDEREQYDERLSREDCRMASRAALTAALSSEANNDWDGEK